VSSDETTNSGIDEGIALALRAEDSGDWKPVADWLARNPDHAGGLAEFLAAQLGLQVAAGPLPIAPENRSGSLVGGLVLREEIGRGAMGVVYRAFDADLKRDVAVKLVRTGGDLTAVERARFRSEAEAVASLDHPNIVPVHSFGESGGQPYLVMPLMTGGSLAAWLKTLGPDRCRPAKQAAEIVRDIALGIHHAHQRGLIHRDLKPGNILLDRDGVPHIADFGLARHVDATMTGGIVGTPAYMAPEQARVEKHLTTAVDVHALGVILFELLIGQVPFGGKDTPSVMARVAEEPALAVRQLRPDVPRDLETICSRCLNKIPQERYPSAQSLADDLTKFLKGEPIGDRRGWVWGTVSRALGWQRETAGMSSWRVTYWGAASTILAMAVMQTAVLLDAPLWVSQAAIAYYLLAWLGLMWIFLVAPRTSRNPVERASTAIHFGAKFSCMAILPVQLWLHDGNPVFALPSFLALVGLAVFAHGTFYWGRLYLVGLIFFAAAAALPMVPITYWPGLYGLLLGTFQLLVGIHLRRVHESGEAAVRSLTDVNPV
jgi:serine/threonine-protein kinase